LLAQGEESIGFVQQQTPPEDITQVELPWTSASSNECLTEVSPLAANWYTIMRCNQSSGVLGTLASRSGEGQLAAMGSTKTLVKRLMKDFAGPLRATTLVYGILGGEDTERRVREKVRPNSGTYTAPVIQYSIESLEHRLWGQIHFSKENPMPLLCIALRKRPPSMRIHPDVHVNRQVRATQVCQVGLIGEIDTAQMIAADIGKDSYEAGLSYARAPSRRMGFESEKHGHAHRIVSSSRRLDVIGYVELV